MTSHTVAQLMATLGVTKSHSRPHVSNDNPFSESQFKTLKYRPAFPNRFGCQEDTRESPTDPYGSLRETPRALRQQTAHADDAPRSGLDQSTSSARPTKRASGDHRSPEAQCTFGAPSIRLSLTRLRPRRA